MDDLNILERWRVYYQKLMNEKNPREGRMSSKQKWRMTLQRQCRIKVVRGPWHILSAGPLRRGLATFATSTGARETVGEKLGRFERGWQ